MPVLEMLVPLATPEYYVEPFVGGGSFYFYFALRVALLSDLNEELINAYREVRDHPNEIIKHLKTLPVDIETYEEMREPRERSELERAVRFLYLNRTAFSGIYRLNQRGDFNVPFGGDRTPELLWRTDILRHAARALQDAELRVSDFEQVIAEAPEGSLIYCDPTYSVKGLYEEGGFARYNSRVFSWADQERLAKTCRDAARRSSTVLVSNAHDENVASLYPEAEHHVVERQSRLAANIDGRNARAEYLFVLRPR